MFDNYYSLYKHTHKSNGKCYFGITRLKPEKRWANGAGYNCGPFADAIRAYGWDGFKHEIISEGLTMNEAVKAERDLIKSHRSNEADYGYNKSAGGQTGSATVDHTGDSDIFGVVFTFLGRKFTCFEGVLNRC